MLYQQQHMHTKTHETQRLYAGAQAYPPMFYLWMKGW